MDTMTETDICIQFTQWMRIKYPKVLFTHIANERKCSPQYGAKLKAMGLLKGWPDYIITAPSGACIDNKMGFYKMLALEMKSAKGKLTPAQKLVRSKFPTYVKYRVAWSFEEAVVIVNDYLGVTDDCTRNRQ